VKRRQRQQHDGGIHVNLHQAKLTASVFGEDCGDDVAAAGSGMSLEDYARLSDLLIRVGQE
jgi:hypothetical protein